MLEPEETDYLLLIIVLFILIQVTIRGQLFPHEGGMGKSRFLIPVDGDRGEDANATGIGSVEELCLAHYQQQGFDQGKRFGFYTFL